MRNRTQPIKEKPTGYSIRWKVGYSLIGLGSTSTGQRKFSLSTIQPIWHVSVTHCFETKYYILEC